MIYDLLEVTPFRPSFIFISPDMPFSPFQTKWDYTLFQNPDTDSNYKRFGVEE
jgi:hypothetical protein